MSQFEDDPTSQLLRYHTELIQMCESVRAMYSRYLPLFILACAETAALFVSCAIKLGSDPAMNMHYLGLWIQSQPLLYVNLALLPPLFIIGYLMLLAVLVRREQFLDSRAQNVRHEIEKVLQAKSNLVLQGEPVTASFMERVVHRPAPPRQPMVARPVPVHDQRIGMSPPPPPPHE